MMGRGDYTATFLWLLVPCLSLFTGPVQSVPYPDPGPAAPLTGPEPHIVVNNPRIIEGPQDTYVVKNTPASLDCKAEGTPPPKITWFQNGQEIDFGLDQVHRMILDGGQKLFFLRIIHTKTNRPDVGEYYCKASNVHGQVTSRVATVKLAVIRDDFRQEPVDTKVIHSTAVLQCRSPRGDPEPTVSWLHNGKPVTLRDDVKLHPDGDLVFSRVTKQDAGEYICVADNDAGEKRSSPAQLTVIVRPEITHTPDDRTADEGQTVEFECSSELGLEVQWKKDGGQIDAKRGRILKDRTLRIENVAASDEGAYICWVQNDAGSAEAVAHLKVEYTPTFLIRPRNQAVAAGRIATFQCSAMGNSVPAIFWRTQQHSELLFGNNKKNYGRFSVATDGTLRIEHVQKSDEGEYVCLAINSKGEAQASAFLTVRDNDDRPPPIIRFGPQNQTLPQEGVALLRCQAIGSPQPVIRWYRQGRPLQRSETRYTHLDSGTLQISSLKVSDSGRYLCKAVSETGETTAEAVLTVESQLQHPGEPLKGPPDISTFPGAPEKPVVSDVLDTSVRLSWEQINDAGASEITGYQVEFFGYGHSQSWQVVNQTYQHKDVTIEGLVPNTTYVFLVRAKNSYGTGSPSHLSDRIQTLERYPAYFHVPVITLPKEQVALLVPKVTVRLQKGKAVNASAIRISWQVDNELGVVDGFVLQYRHIISMGDRDNILYGASQRKALPYRPLSYLLNGLDSYEYYEICIMAASGVLTSPCSSPMKIQSGESVPTEPPRSMVIHRESDTQVLVTWKPPGIEDRKGEIIGYFVKCFSEDGSHNCSLATNGSTHSVRIEGLIPGVNYNIEMAAQTGKGFGRWSAPFSVGPDQADITKEAWFIGVIAGVGSTLWVALCIFTIWQCRSHKQRKKLKEQKEQWYTGDSRTSEKSTERNGNVRKAGYGVKEGSFQDSNDSGLPAEFSTLLQQSQHEDDEHNDNMYNVARDHPEMSTFYQKSGPVTPYATTALLQAQAQQNRMQNGDQKFRPVVPGYHQHSGGSGDSNTDRSITTDVSIESPQRNPGSTGDSGNLSDENGILVKQQRMQSYRGKPGNQPIVNWTEVLPPPPNHPPGDGDFLPDDQLYSEIPEDQTCSPMSPKSTCSCPVPHSQQIPGYNVPPMYTDNCNKCQSLRQYDNRPYSPQQMVQYQRQQGYPPNMPRNAHHPQLPPMNIQRGGGTPVYMHGYSQPWDCQPLHRGPYDYDFAQVPRDDGYNYTQPIQDGLIGSNTLRGRDKNFHPQKGHSVSGDSSGSCSGSQRGEVMNMNIPGGPPGNYCEGPCRGQMEALNNLNNYNMSVRSDNTPMAYLEGYKIESPPAGNLSSSEYKVLGGGSQSSATDSGTSEQKSSYKGRSSMEGSDLKDRQFHPSSGSFHNSRPESSPTGHCMVDEGFSRNADSPVSEDPDYAEESDHGGDHHNERDSMVANWESMEDCSSVHSSSSNVSDEANLFINEEDFASAVAHAAVMSGLTVEGTVVSNPNPKSAKRSRHRRVARPPSPGYSTDSNYGTTNMVHKPYPKSQRRKQMANQGKARTKGDKAKITNITTGNIGTKTDGESPDHNPKTSLPETPTNTAPSKYPSLYRNKAPEGAVTQEVQMNTGSTAAKVKLFKFSEDIPVV